MKHTDKFFLFPIKVYNESFKDDEPEDTDWVLGYARLPLGELYDITWFDCYTKGKEVADVSKKGPDLTQIYSERFGRYICLWDRKKFESKLNDYIEKLEKQIQDENTEIRQISLHEDSSGQTQTDS